MTTKEAAVFLGFSDSSRIRQLILEGKLIAEKHGRDWTLDEEVVREYADQMECRLPDPKRRK